MHSLFALDALLNLKVTKDSVKIGILSELLKNKDMVENIKRYPSISSFYSIWKNIPRISSVKRK